jgi:hypothetical protein
VAKVNRGVIDGNDPWFTNEATKFVTGLGAFDEFKNRKAIPVHYITTVRIAP